MVDSRVVQAATGGSTALTCDIWSFGCCLATFATKKMPYADKGYKSPLDIIKVLQGEEGEAQPLSQLTDVNISASLRAIAERCCSWDPAARPDFTALAQELQSDAVFNDVYGADEVAAREEPMSASRPNRALRR